MAFGEAAFTRAEYDQLPEGFPAQLVGGCLVKEPSTTYGHQVVTGRIYAALVALLGHERVPMTPVDVVLDEHNVYAPDVVVLAGPRAWDDRDVGVPLVAIEVLSPSTARRDRGVKRRTLLERGVAEVWIVDPEDETIEVHDAAGVRAARGDDGLASTVIPNFSLVPSTLFRRP